MLKLQLQSVQSKRIVSCKKIIRDGFFMVLKLKPKEVEKPWGKETWLVYNDRYALKLIFIAKGKRLSLQYHKIKTESWYILKGLLEITLGEETFQASPGEVFHIPNGMIHRLKAIEDSEIIEVSTPELDDVVRVEDDFGRLNE